MHQVIARYKVKLDRAEENLELVQAVYDGLERTKPAGLRYATFLLDDGVSFFHIARADADPNPLPQVAAFSGVPARDRRPLRGATAGERGTGGRRLPLLRSGLRQPVLSGLGVRHRRGGYRDPESQALIASWFGKLKQREVWLNEYETLVTAIGPNPLPR